MFSLALDALLAACLICGGMPQHTHIKGLGTKLERFTGIMEDIKGRPYDLLDFTVTQFDRDILEFNVHINELELALKVSSSSAIRAQCRHISCI